MIQNSKALKLGLVFSFTAMLLLSLFQNCQKGSPNVEGMSEESSETDATNDSNNSNTSAPAVIPFNPGPLTTGSYAYAPIRQDQVCQDTNADRKAIIMLYIKHLRRCADRPGLDWWYHSQIRASASLSWVEQAITGSVEYQNRNMPANNASSLYCLSGDTYEILANNQVLSAMQIESVYSGDTRTFASRCRTSKSQNPAAAASLMVHDSLAIGKTSGEALVCSVPGNTLKNHILDLYLTYLDRCADSSGLDWWATHWQDDASFIGNSDVQKYMKCRYPNGDMAQTPQATIDACYLQEFNTALCTAGSSFIKPRFCHRVGN